MNECTAMTEIFTLSVDCTGLTMEASQSTESTESTTQTNSSIESPAVTSEVSPQSQSSGHQPSTLPMSTSGLVTALSPTDSTSVSREGPSPSTAHATQPSKTPSDSSSRATEFSNNNLSQGGQIAIGVVVPVLTLLAGLIFGIRAWSRRVTIGKSSRKLEASQTVNNANIELQRTDQGTLPLRRPMIDPPRVIDQSWI